MHNPIQEIPNLEFTLSMIETTQPSVLVLLIFRTVTGAPVGVSTLPYVALGEFRVMRAQHKWHVVSPRGGGCGERARFTPVGIPIG